MSHNANEIAARLVLEMWAKHHEAYPLSSVWRGLKESKSLPMSQAEAAASVFWHLRGKSATAKQVRHLKQWYRLHGAMFVEPALCLAVDISLDIFRQEVELDLQQWFEAGQVREAA